MEIKGDSYVLESNIHFPVDLAQLWDSNRKVLNVLSRLGFELTEHRQLNSLSKKLANLNYACGQIHRKKGKNYKERLRNPVLSYLKQSRHLLTKAEETLRNLSFAIALCEASTLTSVGTHCKNTQLVKLYNELNYYLDFLRKCIDLVDRRLIQGEEIPHSDKILSIFEPDVEWISKGKAGKAVEFGHRHLIYTDQYHFILHHQVLYKQTDKEVALSAAEQMFASYGTANYLYKSLSYDRGFYSGPAKKSLGFLFERVIMPKPGKKSVAVQQQESDVEFVKLRHRHSAVESNINSLEHTGLNKCPDKGFEKFKNYAATGVLTYNLRQLGKWITKLEQSERLKKPSNKSFAKAA